MTIFSFIILGKDKGRQRTLAFLDIQKQNVTVRISGELIVPFFCYTFPILQVPESEDELTKKKRRYSILRMRMTTDH